MPADKGSARTAWRGGQHHLRRRTVLGGLGATVLAPLGRRAQAAPQTLAAARAKALATGFNLPGVCDVAPEEARLPSRALLSFLARRGFRSMRLPVDPQLCAEASPAFRGCLQHIATRILESGTALALDMHPGDEVSQLLRGDPSKGGELIMAAWKHLATQAAALPPDRVMLELLNEPPLPAESWRALRQSLIEEVRRIAPNHTLVWGAAQFQTIEDTVADAGPDDTNAMAAVHYYYPMVFTHQGQSWGHSPYAPIRQLPFPFDASDPQVRAIASSLRAAGRADGLAELENATARPWNSGRIDEDFGTLRAWSQASGWPVIVNEFGVYRDYAPEDSRARWLEAVRHAAERNGFGWCHWELDAGFGFTRSRTDAASLDESVVAALVGTQTGN